MEASSSYILSRRRCPHARLHSQSLLLAGTSEQKQRYLPRLVGGELVAYALTEPAAGSDVAGILTTVERRGMSTS